MAIERKKLFDVELPIGQTVQLIATEPAALKDRVIKLDLTRLLKGRNIEARFVVAKVEGNKGVAEFTSLTMLSSFMRRMMKKGVSYVEDSFTCPAKDAKIRLKPFMLTRKKVHRAVRAALRNKTRELLEEYVKKNHTQEIFKTILSSRLQRDISTKLKKIYPLAFCEIRSVAVEK